MKKHKILLASCFFAFCMNTVLLKADSMENTLMACVVDESSLNACAEDPDIQAYLASSEAQEYLEKYYNNDLGLDERCGSCFAHCVSDLGIGSCCGKLYCASPTCLDDVCVGNPSGTDIIVIIGCTFKCW